MYISDRFFCFTWTSSSCVCGGRTRVLLRDERANGNVCVRVCHVCVCVYAYGGGRRVGTLCDGRGPGCGIYHGGVGGIDLDPRRGMSILLRVSAGRTRAVIARAASKNGTVEYLAGPMNHPSVHPSCVVIESCETPPTRVFQSSDHYYATAVETNISSQGRVFRINFIITIMSTPIEFRH